MPDKNCKCSFCGKTSDNVYQLVKGIDEVYICDECIYTCSEIIKDKVYEDFRENKLVVAKKEDK